MWWIWWIVNQQWNSNLIKNRNEIKFTLRVGFSGGYYSQSVVRPPFGGGGVVLASKLDWAIQLQRKWGYAIERKMWLSMSKCRDNVIEWVMGFSFLFICIR